MRRAVAANGRSERLSGLTRSVFVPVVVDGVTETATSVVKVVEEITTTMVSPMLPPDLKRRLLTAVFAVQTQTAVATKVVQTTVVSGKVRSHLTAVAST